MTDLSVRTESLGGSPLARAALAGSVPAGWYVRCPRDPAAWRTRAEAVRRDVPASWAERLAPAFAASGAAAERLARSAGGRGIVVTTGQQPGLFGGPLYTWFKALTARALADAIEAATGVPTAPVFWAATDDADFAEAAETWVALPGEAARLVLPPSEGVGLPLAEVPLGDVSEPLRVLERACGSAAYAGALELVRRSYAEGATVGGAYLALLRGMLEPLGIAVLDASHPAVRAAGDELLRRALLQAPAVERAVAARDAEIEAAGFSPQVSAVGGLSLVAAREPGGPKARVPIARAAEVASDGDALLGATVLLRPVLERFLLPTVAYAAGPGEFAYFAQVGAVADALGAATPLPVPRWSGTIVEPHVQRVLDRLGLTVEALRDPHAPERELARALLPPGVASALGALDEALERTAAALATHGASLLPPAVPEGFLAQARQRTARLERRYRAAVRRAEEATFRDLATARAALRPGGIPQERALNLIPLLARYGEPLLHRVLAAARAHATGLVGAAHPDATHERPTAAGALT